MSNETNEERINYLDKNKTVREIVQGEKWQVETHVLEGGTFIDLEKEGRFYIGTIPGLTQKVHDEDYLYKETELTKQEILQIIDNYQFFKVNQDKEYSPGETLSLVTSPSLIRKLISAKIEPLIIYQEEEQTWHEVQLDLDDELPEDLDVPDGMSLFELSLEPERENKGDWSGLPEDSLR